jgi:hypothetical protein
MKLLLITLTAGIFAVTAAHAGDPNPSFHDGHWFHITKNGVRIHKAPTCTSPEKTDTEIWLTNTVSGLTRTLHFIQGRNPA